MARVPKRIAHELIQYVKRIDVKMNYWDPTARSAFEFARQMSSPKLKKINPGYDCQLALHETSDVPVLRVEYTDGSVWEEGTQEYKMNELRAKLFSKAEEAEDVMERTGTDAPAKVEEAKKGGKKK